MFYLIIYEKVLHKGRKTTLLNLELSRFRKVKQQSSYVVIGHCMWRKYNCFWDFSFLLVSYFCTIEAPLYSEKKSFKVKQDINWHWDNNNLDLPPSVKNSSIVDNTGTCVFGKITERLGFEMFSFLSHYAKFLCPIKRYHIEVFLIQQLWLNSFDNFTYSL